MEYPVTVIPSEDTREAEQRGGRGRPSVDLSVVRINLGRLTGQPKSEASLTLT
jgi:hypothetical protein